MANQDEAFVSPESSQIMLPILFCIAVQQQQGGIPPEWVKRLVVFMKRNIQRPRYLLRQIVNFLILPPV
ncbi:hypothetical protein RB213_012409 [Colletotrichum asianum]